MYTYRFGACYLQLSFRKKNLRNNTKHGIDNSYLGWLAWLAKNFIDCIENWPRTRQ